MVAEFIQGGVIDVIARTLGIVAFTYLMLRVRGKRQLAQFTLFDVLIIIGLGSAVGDVMIYSESIVEIYDAMLAITAVIAAITLVERLLAKAPAKVVRFIEGKETVLIRGGKVDRKALESENMNLEELKTKLREKNVRSISEVHYARLEPSGVLSIMRKRDHKKAVLAQRRR